MVGLVIVSHSRTLAEALVVLVRQVAPKELPLAIAAGVGQGHREFGTDAVEIIEAIKSVYSPDGVLVLMDLGSAVLSAELALDLLPSEMRENIALCPAPLVEGAIAAGVQAGLGSNIKTVFWEAQKALDPKLEHLSGSMKDEVLATAPLLSSTGTEIASTIFLTLQNLHGLHARPAARLVQVATSYNVDIIVTNETNGTGPVSAKSLNALVTLGGECGHQIAITARGPNASQALDALKKLVLSNFGESSD
jgi:dihydroxyacetone kinase phosphotransfer subunit